MARKLAKPGFVTIAQLARKLGVSGQAVGQAVRSGRLVAYDSHGERVPLGYAGRKWLNSASATEDWHNRRQRYDDSAASDDLTDARTRTAGLQAELLKTRLDRARGATIPRSEATASMDGLGGPYEGHTGPIPGWSQELYEASQTGVGAVSALLRAKFAELGGSIADLITATEAELIEEPPDRGE